MADKPNVPVAELFPVEAECFHDEFQRYFKGKRQNFFLSLKSFRRLWDCLQLLNDIWMREDSDLEHLTDQFHLLPKTIFSSAHVRFLTAIELGFSCCIGDAYSVLRDGIEAVAHAHRIYRDPASAVAWTDKHKGEAELQAHDRIFKWDKKKNLFPDDVPSLKRLYVYYGQFCELATHTSVTSIGKSFKDRSESGRVKWEFCYFETNPQRLAAFLSALLQVSAHMEEAFYDCFQLRLKLDPELDRMRSQFESLRQEQSHYLAGIAKTALPIP